MSQKIVDKRYKVLRKLGSGAMGEVYKVEDLSYNRIIALKIISKKMVSSEAVIRFKREFRLLAELHHPNLCEVYDYGMLRDGRSYFTMEYVEGHNIFEFTKNLLYEKIYPVRKNISNGVYPLIVQLCRVLEYIHSKGLMHYDIKPDNIFIHMPSEDNDNAIVKLMDFGLVGEQRIKGGILIRGTLPYIAPEVIRGLAVDHRADLYSLGVLLYEIFTRKSFQPDGKASFVTLLKLMQDRRYEPPSKIVADIPKGLERLILKLIAFEPAARFSRANEIIKEINKLSRFKFEFETEKTLESYLLSSRFVGRDKEMRILQSLYERACQGEGKVILVTGDAGIGKSRLLKEFRIFAQLRRSHSFIGHAHKDKISPLEPFYEIFKELINYIKDGSDISRPSELKLPLAVLFKIFPDLTDGHLKKNLPPLVPLEPKQEKLRNFDALTELIRHTASELGELVILLEDLHWADDLSIQFLEYLGRNLENRNIFICGTCRKEELKGNLVLKRMMTNLRNEDCLSQIELGPLRFRSLYSFLDSTITPESNSSELVKYLMKKTGGNPFFVEEIMRTLLRKKRVSIGERVEIEDFKRISIPETIEDIVLKRLKGLDSTSQEVVKFGAVLLKDFSYDLMKRLTGLDDTELSRALWELKRRQVLIEEDNKYRFYHATLREAVYKRLRDKERSDLNYQIGKTLERINRQRLSKVVEGLAYYFINAKDRKKGISYGLRAARKSSGRYANEQAIRFYRGVLDLLPDKNLKLRFDILQELAQIENYVGYYDDAIKHYNKTLSLKTGTINKKIKVCLRIASIYAKRGEYNEVLPIYRRGIRLLKKMRSARLKALLEANINVNICRAYTVMGGYKSTCKFNFDGLKLPKEGLKGEEAITLQFGIYNSMGIIESIKYDYGVGDYNKAIVYFKEAYKYGKKIKDENKIAAVLNCLGINYHMTFKFQKAFNCFKKVVQISKKIGDQYCITIGLCNLGNLLNDKGCHSKGSDCFQKALSISRKCGNSIMTCASLLGCGMCFLKLCDYKRAKDYLEKSLKFFDVADWKRHKVHSIEHIGIAYQAMGDYTLSLRYYRMALKISKDSGDQRNIVSLYHNLGAQFTEIGEIPRAKRYIDNALKIAKTIGLKDAENKCYLHLCRINIIMKDYAFANDYYEKGIRTAKELGLKRQVLQFFLLVSEIYYHEKRYLKGAKVANKAIKIAKEMGTKDLYAEALLMKIKNGINLGVISKVEAFKTMEEAKKIAEEIGSPKILWRVYFEYGRYLQNNKEYLEALDYYQKCNGIFSDVISKIKNESFKKSYLSRPDRQAVDTAINEIRISLH